MDAFYKKYIEFFDINKNDDKNLSNILFLMLPFLFVKSFKELHEIKIKDIEIHEFNRCIVIKHTNSLTGVNHTVKMDKFYKEWLYHIQELIQKKFSILLLCSTKQKTQHF